MRWGVIALGIGFFFWLGTEEASALSAALWGISATTIGGFRWARGKLPSLNLSASGRVIAWAAIDGVIGALSGVATIAVMLLKNGLHGHVFPDYPPLMITGIAERAPAWAAAGVLIGTGTGLLWLLRRA